MSKGHSVIKHDDGKSLQFQMAVDLIKVGEFYTKEAIAKAPQEVQDKAQVSEVSKEGATKTDKRLVKKRVEVAAHKKGLEKIPIN